MSRPIPAHGTYARYRGTRSGSRPPCRCNHCTRASRHRAIHCEQNRLNGIPNMVSRDVLLPHINNLRASGMSQILIARRAQVAQATISYLVLGRNQSCQRDKALRILAVQPGDFDSISQRPALPSTRRLQALYAIGHSRIVIEQEAGLDQTTISEIVNGRYVFLDGRTAAAIDLAFRRLAERPGTTQRNRLRAAREGWAPPGAWDDDTIDDPDAAPEWTGHCGTDRGWWMHRLERLPMCPPCETAHEEWKAAHQHLPRTEYMAVIGAARGTAHSREAGLAHDARELMRVSGLDYEQAAERLGVTKQHLQQAMRRHPELAEAA